MNIPINPREGDRRQKALRARLAAMMKDKQNRSRFAQQGQNRGSVRSMGSPRGVGQRFSSGAKPGGLNFLQPFRTGPGVARGREAMQPQAPGFMHRYAAPQLPSQALENGPPGQEPEPAETNHFEQTPEVWDPTAAPGQSTYVPGENTLIEPLPGGNVGASNLIPLGGGAYLDPTTGLIRGGYSPTQGNRPRHGGF